MDRRFLLSLALAALLCLSGATALAAPNWVTMHEDHYALHQADLNAVTFTGEATDRQLEVWMKSVNKDGSGYMIARYYVREKGLTAILKERTMYSSSGRATGKPFVNQTDKWWATTASSPIGAIATRLFTGQAPNPADGASPAAAAGAAQPDAAPIAEKHLPQINPNELKQALDDERIKQEEKNGSKWYRVRDTHTIYYFLDKNRMTADFYLFAHSGAAQTRQLQLTLSDTRPGTHSSKQSVTVQIDGKEWPLKALPSSPGAVGSYEASFTYYFDLPDSLVEAIFATKTGITVKWQYMHGKWKDLEYTIPYKIVRDIQLMYAGCK